MIADNRQQNKRNLGLLKKLTYPPYFSLFKLFVFPKTLILVFRFNLLMREHLNLGLPSAENVGPV
jgi:hypothetical protein